MKNMYKEKLQKQRLCLFRTCVLTLGLFLMTAFTLNAQIAVTGKIIDSDTKEGIPGVNISIKGTTTGTVTDLDGKYTLNVPNQDAILVVSFIGYTTQEITVGSQKEINVSLAPDIAALDEVVVIGYGTARRSDLTGSIASLSSEELKKIPMASTADILKGRLPGVNVTTTDGSPDAEIVIRVRGGGSITQDNSPLYIVDGFPVSSINDIPPTDISSITVLKDAAATAIYGARAANGVIVITTNTAKVGKTRVSYSGYVQMKTLPEERKYKVLDPYEYVMAQYEYAKLKSETDLTKFERYYGKYDDLELYKYKKGTDWQDELFGAPQYSQSHTLSVSGGTEKTNVSLTLSNNKEDGIMKGNGYTRNALNFKISHELFKNLTFDAGARMSTEVVNGSGTSGSSQLRIKDVVTARPVNGIADDLNIDLTTVNSEDDYQSFLLSMINPVQLADQDWRKRSTEKYILNAGLTWKPFDQLTLKTTFTSSNQYRETLRYYGPLTSQSKQEGNSLPLGTMLHNADNSYDWVNTVNYTLKKMGEHHLDFLLGHEVYSSGGKQDFVRAEDFRESMQPKEMFANMAAGTVTQYYANEDTDENRLSFFGRVNYNYKSRYLLTITGRADASSKFSDANRWGIFPAAALAWKLSEEDFMKNISFINELKLRASIGETGNDRIDPESTQFLFKLSTDNGPGFATNDYNPYYTPASTSLYNPDLKWETTINRNLGLDFVLYNGVLGGSFDVYSNSTRDLLLQSTISSNSGFATQWNNIGSTSNKGIELDLTAMIINKSDFSVSANVNFGINRSKIDKLDNTDERFIQSNWASTDLKSQNDYYLKVGETIGLMYGYVSDGMYSTDDFETYDGPGSYTLKDGVVDDQTTLGVSGLRPGYMKLKDLNGDSVITDADRKIIGSALPKATGGFGMDVRYKALDFSILFNWSLGNDIYNTNKIAFNQLYRTTYGNMLSSMSPDKRFTYLDAKGEEVTDLDELNRMNEGKTIWSGNNSFGTATAVFSDWAVEDGSYLRLQTVTLGYTLPSTFTSKLHISSLRVYFTGSNLWVWTKYTGYDPEVSTTRSSTYQALTPGCDYSSYPRSRAYTLGVNVTF